jgi:cold-inducible RNA-binding protein
MVGNRTVAEESPGAGTLVPTVGHGIVKMPFESSRLHQAETDPPSLARTIERQKESKCKMKSIFVGNLDFAATDSSVRSLFERYGNVERVNLVTDRDTGRSRGFAFVEMSDSSQADQAIAALNGTDLNGRTLNINEARPKT